MDKIINLSETQSALASFKAAIDGLKGIIDGNDVTLSTNRDEVKAAWESDNALAFDAQYASLITYITEAYNSLVSYQDKIQAVVNEFQGFDTTIETGE